MTRLFEEYAERSIEWIAKNVKTICPIPKISQAMATCYILEGMLGNGEAFALQQKQLGSEEGSKLLEMLFIYAILWGTSGALAIDKGNDLKDSFSKWFKTEFVKYPFPETQENSSIFEYTVDREKIQWQHWSEKLSQYTPEPGIVFGNIYVVTLETKRLTAILDLVVPYRRPVCFVGGAGTGKTTIMKDKLRNIDSDVFVTLGINFNSFTDSLIAQTAMESVLEKKTGKVFGPPGSKKMIYFIDDLNMPVVDKYGTQQPIALLRQGFDYAAWYDRAKLTLKEVHNLQFLSCMNPTAGSFVVDPRLQRSYMTFSVTMPKTDVLKNIYGLIVKGHFSNGFSPEIQKLGEIVVQATIDLHGQVVKQFLPTAVKFHYNFNLRDTSNIFQGLCRSRPANYPNAISIARLWYHECERVFLDRMITSDDIEKFVAMLTEVNKKYFADMNQEKLNLKPNLFTTFTTPGVDDTDRPYCNISEMAKLSAIVEDRLKEYNESNAVMNLVMFDQAVEHVCRITRVIDQPRGNALLVGVGGSGKQSLAKLSAFIVGYETFQITVTATYSMTGTQSFYCLIQSKFS
jgi:dynein heavy chain